MLLSNLQQRARPLVHAFANDKWTQGRWLSTSKNNKNFVVVDKHGGKITATRLIPVKHGGKRRPSQPTEKYIPRKRLTPFHLPVIEIVASVFTGGGKPGDFLWQCRNPEYDDCLHIFNDNVKQWGQECHIPGGGNAIIRPYRAQCKAIGIPTGSFGIGGFQSLCERHWVRNAWCSSHDIIILAVGEVVSMIHTREMMGMPVRRLVFCVDPTDGLIGMGIFNIAHDVRVLITQRITQISDDLAHRYRMDRQTRDRSMIGD